MTLAQAQAARSPCTRWHLVGAVGVAVLVCALYAPSVANPLVWDDLIQAQPAAALHTSHRPVEYSRPVVLLSYRVQHALGLGSPAALHGANVGLHALNAILLVLLLGSVGLSAALATAAGLVFALHPIQSGSVAYVSGRTDLLACLFVLLAVQATILRERLPPLVGAVLVGVLCLLAALSKEVGVVAGPLCMLAAFSHVGQRGVGDGRPDRHTRVAWWLGPALALAVGLAWVLPPAVVQGLAISPSVRLRAAGTTFGTYAELLVWPHDLHLDRFTPIGGWVAGVLGAAVLVAMAAIVWGWLASRSRAWTAFAAAVLVYLPGSNLVPVYPAIVERWVFTPEQFLYLPTAAFAVLVAGGVARLLAALLVRVMPTSSAATGRASRLVASSRAAAISVLVAALALAATWAPIVRARQTQFADEESVYRATLAHSPSPRACFNLGVVLLARQRPAEAVSVYEECSRLTPNDASVYAQLGVAYQKTGNPLRARLAYAHALELDDGDPYAWSNYASLEATQGLYDAARKKWERALQIEPDFGPARRGLAKLDAISRSEPRPQP